MKCVIAGIEEFYPGCRFLETMAAKDAKDPPFNINTATEDQLKTLSGIGTARAKAVRKFIQEYGPISSLKFLMGRMDPLTIQALTEAFLEEYIDCGRNNNHLEEVTVLKTSLNHTEGRMKEIEDEFAAMKLRQDLEQQQLALRDEGEKTLQADNTNLQTANTTLLAEVESLKRQLGESHQARVLAETKADARGLDEDRIGDAKASYRGAKDPKDQASYLPGHGDRLGPRGTADEDDRSSRSSEQREKFGPNGPSAVRGGGQTLDWPLPRQHSTPAGNGQIRGNVYYPRQARGGLEEHTPVSKRAARPKKSKPCLNGTWMDEDSSSSSSSSDEDYRQDRGQAEHRPSGHRRSDTGKVPTYDGKVRWETYADQFTRIARKCNWDKEARLDNLVQHLRDDALDYYGTLPRRERRDFDYVKKAFKVRFSRRSHPQTARRALQVIRQSQDEELEQFAQRCQTLARDGFRKDSERTIEKVAMDAFLHGCSDRRAALMAGEKNIQSMRELVQSVEHSVQNAKAILGDKKVRSVTFGESDDHYYQPSVSKIEKKPDSMSDDFKKIVEQMIATALAERMPRRPARSSSPYPSRSRSRSTSPGRSRECYNCQEEGHFARECPKPRNQMSAQTKPVSEN